MVNRHQWFPKFKLTRATSRIRTAPVCSKGASSFDGSPRCLKRFSAYCCHELSTYNVERTGQGLACIAGDEPGSRFSVENGPDRSEGPGMTMTDFTTVAQVGDIPVGTGQAFNIHQRFVAVFHSQDGYHAIDDICPHMGASLAGGHFEEDVVSCPWHAWRFSVLDGTWCDNPRIKIDNFEVRVVGNEIQVKVSAESMSKDGDSS